MTILTAPVVPQATEASVGDHRQLARHINDISTAIRQTARETRLNDLGLAKSLYGTYASRPLATSVAAGTRYIASDGLVEYVSDGSAWRPIILGAVGTEVAPGNQVSSSWTAMGTAISKRNIQGGCVYLLGAAGSNPSLSGYEKPKLSGQTIIVHAIRQEVPSTSSAVAPSALAGVWARDSVGGRAAVIAFGKDTNTSQKNVVVATLNSTTSWNATVLSATDDTVSHGVWLRIKDDGTNNVFGYSMDGINFFDAVSTTWVPSRGTQYGFGTYGSAAVGITFDSVALS